MTEERKKELLRISCPDWIEPLKPTMHALRKVTPKVKVPSDKPRGWKKGRPRSKKKIKDARRMRALYRSNPEYRVRNKSVLTRYMPRRAKVTL